MQESKPSFKLAPSRLVPGAAPARPPDELPAAPELHPLPCCLLCNLKFCAMLVCLGVRGCGRPGLLEQGQGEAGKGSQWQHAAAVVVALAGPLFGLMDVGAGAATASPEAGAGSS